MVFKILLLVFLVFLWGAGNDPNPLQCPLKTKTSFGSRSSVNEFPAAKGALSVYLFDKGPIIHEGAFILH